MSKEIKKLSKNIEKTSNAISATEEAIQKTIWVAQNIAIEDINSQIAQLQSGRTKILEDISKDITVAKVEREKLVSLETKKDNLIQEKQVVIDTTISELKTKFKGATKFAQRMLIANDVLESINVGLYVPTDSNGYVDISSDFRRSNSLQECIISTDINENNCKVCALGSMLMTHVKYTNKLNVGEANDVEGDQIRERLSKYFSATQLDMIESAFELNYTIIADSHNIIEDSEEDFRYEYINRFDKNPTKGLVNKLTNAVEFGKKFKNANKRLVAIMENIIENEGTFKPED